MKHIMIYHFVFVWRAKYITTLNFRRITCVCNINIYVPSYCTIVTNMWKSLRFVMETFVTYRRNISFMYLNNVKA